MKRRWVVSLIALFCATTGSYTLSLVAATPEELLRRPFACPDQPQVEAKEFKVLAVRKWAKGVVALYRGKCPSLEKRFAQDPKPEDEDFLSYRVTYREGMEWRLSSSGNHQIQKKSSQAKEKSLIEYGVGRKISQESRGNYAVFFGKVLDPEVATVEVTFNNGKTLRDTSTDGLFLLVSPGATTACDVRVLGVDKQILQRDELVYPKSTSSAIEPCQPISGQL
jgi:hypothetical protein